MTTSDQTSHIAGALVSSPSASLMTTSSSFANAITCRLTRTNFLLWKAQVVPILRGIQLFGYLDGTTPMPLATVTEGTGATVRQEDNPARSAWIIQDQAILGGLLSSMTEDVLPQLTCINTSAEVWRTLHTMFSTQHRRNAIQIRT